MFSEILCFMLPSFAPVLNTRITRFSPAANESLAETHFQHRANNGLVS